MYVVEDIYSASCIYIYIYIYIRLHLHTVVSLIATCAGGVFPSTHWLMLGQLALRGVLWVAVVNAYMYVVKERNSEQ